MMLVLTRRLGEEIVIADNIRVTILALTGQEGSLGTKAPASDSSGSPGSARTLRASSLLPRSLHRTLIPQEKTMNPELDADTFTISTGPQQKAILAALEQRIQSRLNNWVCDFRLFVRDGGLVLQGRSFTYYAKQQAQHMVMETIYLPICANEIEVL